MVSHPGEAPDADQRLQVIPDPDDPTKSVAIMPTAADPSRSRRAEMARCGDGVVFAVSPTRRRCVDRCRRVARSQRLR